MSKTKLIASLLVSTFFAAGAAQNVLTSSVAISLVLDMLDSSLLIEL